MMKTFGFSDAMKLLKLGGLLRRSDWAPDEFVYVACKDGDNELFRHRTIDVCDVRANLTGDDLMADDWQEVELIVDTHYGNPGFFKWDFIDIVRNSWRDGSFVQLDGVTLEDVDYAREHYKRIIGQQANYIAVCKDDLRLLIAMHTDSGQLERASHAVLLNSGFVGRLQGIVVVTDTYMRPEDRFISWSFVC